MKSILKILGQSAIACACIYAQDVSVTVDLSGTYMISNFEIGLTHVQSNWQNGNPQAVQRVKSLLVDGRIRFHNIHIMGWGPGNPEPSPGNYQWGTLDSRIELVRSMNAVAVMTFCTAPGWMKTGGNDWDMEDRVADEHVDDFAGLCRAAAVRYPDIRYFQIWNELKGYWSPSLNNWDHVRFTGMYNAVYDAVKSARPDAVIGGPYIPLNGEGLLARDRVFLDYWLENMHGADFFTFDGWIEGYPPRDGYEAEKMARTDYFGRIASEIRERTVLPVWISEYYGGITSSDQFTAANHASCYYHSLISGSAMALHWDPVGFGPLFTGTGSSGGGQPLPHYHVIRAFNQHFGPGTQLYATASSSPEIEVLASAQKTMLINKRPDRVTVDVNGTNVALEGYEVRVIDTPGGGPDAVKALINFPDNSASRPFDVYDVRGRLTGRFTAAGRPDPQEGARALPGGLLVRFEK